MINLAGGVKMCELWKCLHPSGLAYDYTGDTVEKQCFSLHREVALQGASEVVSLRCVFVG